MKHEQPNYYSIIPATVRYDDKLKANEKLLYGEITALANKNGYCWAENKYFAKLYDVHKITVSNWISNLEKQGYIAIKLEYIKGTKQVSKRYIYINDNPTPISEKANRYKPKDLQGINEKTNTPISEKAKEELNNTSINNTSINKEHSPAKAEPRIPYEEIVGYLNEKADRNYKHTTNKTKELIKARCNEGFELDDFKNVIDIKTTEWANTDMDQYLRPVTLFGTKFESYLNQTPETNEGGSYGGLEY